jgi:hypothetical protein
MGRLLQACVLSLGLGVSWAFVGPGALRKSKHDNPQVAVHLRGVGVGYVGTGWDLSPCGLRVDGAVLIAKRMRVFGSDMTTSGEAACEIEICLHTLELPLLDEPRDYEKHLAERFPGCTLLRWHISEVDSSNSRVFVEVVVQRSSKR